MSKITTPKPPSFPALVQQFFTEYLVAQRAVSPRTVACYRDALMLFLDFASRKLGKVPTAMRLADIQSDLIIAFLDYLQQDRHNAVRSRNLRLSKMKADILVTHEAPSAHAHGFAAIDELAVRLGAKLVVHGHHHQSIDYLKAGLITGDSPFLAHGVDKDGFLAWPPGSPT